MTRARAQRSLRDSHLAPSEQDPHPRPPAGHAADAARLPTPLALAPSRLGFPILPFRQIQAQEFPPDKCSHMRHHPLAPAAPRGAGEAAGAGRARRSQPRATSQGGGGRAQPCPAHPPRPGLPRPSRDRGATMCISHPVPSSLPPSLPFPTACAGSMRAAPPSLGGSSARCGAVGRAPRSPAAARPQRNRGDKVCGGSGGARAARGRPGGRRARCMPGAWMNRSRRRRAGAGAAAGDWAARRSEALCFLF